MTDTPRHYPDWIEAYMEYSHRSEPPDSFKRWSAISAIAACLQRKCNLNWAGPLYPNMYIILVGPSGSRKGTAMRPVRAMLDGIGINLSPEAVTREQLIIRLRQSASSALVDMITEPHSSLTVFSEELTVFLGYDNKQLMSDLCDWFDCPNPWRYETKNMGKDNIDRVWLNIIGGTTPSLIQSTLPQEAIGGGLTSRMIFVYEERKGKSISRPQQTIEEIEMEELLKQDLTEIYMLQGEFIPTDGFMTKWDKWYLHQDAHPPFDNPRLGGYVQRRGIHVLKLCMIMSASRRSGIMDLHEVDLERAIFELERIERKMPETFAGVGRLDTGQSMKNIMGFILFNKRVTKKSLIQRFHTDVTTKELNEIIDTMMMMGKCKWGDTTGTIIEAIDDKNNSKD